MRVHRESVLPLGADRVWSLVKTSELLRHVCHPLVQFEGVEPPDLPLQWEEGATVTLRSYLFGIVPLGLRSLYFEAVDDSARRIRTRESDPLIRQWNHTIAVDSLDDGTTRYSDSIEIDAGWLTMPVYLFAKFLYRHRHNRWRRLAMREE